MQKKMNKKGEDSKKYQAVVKAQLDKMGIDLRQMQQDQELKNEPETRVKLVVNRSVA